MIRVNDNNKVQLFTTPFEQELDLENRWVKFSILLPWNKLSSFYYSPTDLGILYESREKPEELIYIICNKTGQIKQRLYRITARKQYLNVTKKKRELIK